MSKVAIVTGASSGIGLSVAKMWAARGGRVALVARTASTLEAIAKEIGEDKAAPFPLDVRDLKALASLPARLALRGPMRQVGPASVPSVAPSSPGTRCCGGPGQLS